MYSNHVKASPLKRLLQGAVALAAFFLVSGMALAAQPQGEWRGLVQQANTDVAAELQFSADAVRVHFGERFSCSAPAKFLKESGAATIYRFGVSKNGGGFCDGLVGKDLTVSPGSNGHLAITFDSAKTTWHGDLTQAAGTHP